MPFYKSLAALLVASAFAGCASGQTAKPPGSPSTGDDPEALKAQLTEMRATLTQNNQRMEALETKIGALNDKATATQNGLDIYLSNTHAAPAGVTAHPSEGAGTPPQVRASAHDPEAGFTNDDASQSFRKTSILLEAQKYSDSVLAFSSFLEKYPDHPLAGSAQYYLGEAYYRQKEYKLALREFERVLTSYDRSPHIADTLHQMADVEDRLKMTERSARHRQLLTSLFPQSPAASFKIAPEKAAEASATPALDAPPASAAATPTVPLTAPMTESGEHK